MKLLLLFIASIALITLILFYIIPHKKTVPLPSLNADINKITVSGLSSGGYMAVQLHVAHSATIKGAGIFAGGPYYCSEGKFLTAVERGMQPKTGESLPNIDKLAEWTESLAKSEKIDSLEHLKESKVWIFSGTKDRTVFPSVVKKLQEYYTRFVNPKNIYGSYDLEAGHGLITESYGSECSLTQPPFINQCNYDAAGKVLAHLYGDLNPPSDKAKGKVIEFNQHEFVLDKDSAQICIAEKGYAYVPEICKTEQCGIHIFLHGCKQYAGKIGKELIEHGGYNRWADQNKLIILYPQATPSTILKIKRVGELKNQNPFGCWDWWGYSDPDFYSKNAPQIKVIKGMIDRLVSKGN